ncbi:hypothetical protein MD484_g8938, partial [Candolleomyces efflorescens]
MTPYGTPEELEWIQTAAPFARQAASEGPGRLETFISYTFLRYITRFPCDDPEGREDSHPEVRLARCIREKEFTMDLLDNIAWECYTCANISLPVTWTEYVGTAPDERGPFDRDIRAQYEQLRIRRAEEERCRAMEELERARLADEEDARLWREWATAPCSPPRWTGSSIENAILIED